MSALDAAALVIGSRTVPIPAVLVDVAPEDGGEERVRQKNHISTDKVYIKPFISTV